jgi:hypothetical protein
MYSLLVERYRWHVRPFPISAAGDHGIRRRAFPMGHSPYQWREQKPEAKWHWPKHAQAAADRLHV